MKEILNKAVTVLRQGGVIAYPTEYCFGLGCDPRQVKAIQRILAIKQRQAQQGLILIAADLHQINFYAQTEGLERLPEIKASWPGPNTWLLPAKASVNEWLRGRHTSIAMRIPQHNFCLSLCTQFDHAIVSTSANRHGQADLINMQEVEDELGNEVDYIVDGSVGGAEKASTIRDAISGEICR